VFDSSCGRLLAIAPIAAATKCVQQSSGRWLQCTGLRQAMIFQILSSVYNLPPERFS